MKKNCLYKVQFLKLIALFSKKLKYHSFLFITFPFILNSCSPKNNLNSNFANSADQIFQFNNDDFILKNDPTVLLERYNFDATTTLSERIVDTPSFVLDYVRNLDNEPEYQNYSLTTDEYKTMEDYLELIPKPYKKVLKKYLIGIYFIENLWGSGLTNFVDGPDGEIYTVIYLNPKLLKMNLNESMLYKEESCFIQSDDSYEIKYNFSEDYNGILYVLFHELTHAVDFSIGLSPYTHTSLLESRKESQMNNYLKNIWSAFDAPRPQYRPEIFKEITYYGSNDGPRIDISDATQLYNELKKTPFTTLYSVKSWSEDVAELFTIYFLTQNLNLEYKIDLIKDKELIYSISPLDNDKVQKRFKMIKKWFI